MTTIVRDGRVAPPGTRLKPLEALGRRIVMGALARIRCGQVTLIDGDHSVRRGDPTTGHDITILVRDHAFYASVGLGGSLGAAEAYIDGLWDCDALEALVELLLDNYAALSGVDGGLKRGAAPVTRAAYWLQRNSRSGSGRNIRAHYDLSNEFFELFLDPSMTYSCGVYESEGTTLEAAQIEKIDLACRKLDLKPTDHLLEIGTGWGALAIHAASEYGCRVTTTTISENQHAEASRRIRAAGLSDRIELLKRDYRDLEGSYDKLVSIEMIEAVGHQYLDGYFQTVSRLLRPEGLALIQAITIRDQFYERAKVTRDFLKKYIFPGSCLLSVEAMSRSLKRNTDLRITDLHDIGPHYATTLRQWNDRFHARLDEVRALGFDDRFIRMWRYYLTYCEGAFRARHCSDVQMLLAKPMCRRAPLR